MVTEDDSVAGELLHGDAEILQVRADQSLRCLCRPRRHRQVRREDPRHRFPVSRYLGKRRRVLALFDFDFDIWFVEASRVTLYI